MSLYHMKTYTFLKLRSAKPLQIIYTKQHVQACWLAQQACQQQACCARLLTCSTGLSTESLLCTPVDLHNLLVNSTPVDLHNRHVNSKPVDLHNMLVNSKHVDLHNRLLNSTPVDLHNMLHICLLCKSTASLLTCTTDTTHLVMFVKYYTVHQGFWIWLWDGSCFQFFPSYK